ncbi:MAG TPA: heme-binding protein [Caulobacteraceae bacterium]|nr:heme-binding protein [Caulobacteraceae bacterium]
MTKPLLLALVALSVAGAAQAQAPAPAGGPPPPAPPRARGPSAALAVEAAQTALATCRASGYKVTATVVDSAGVPVVVLTDDGAPERTQAVGLTKTAAALKYKMSSGDVANKVKTDAAMDAAVKADPKIGVARPGAFPILVGGEMIGAMSVSGAPGGDKDEACVKPALDKIQSRLR